MKVFVDTSVWSLALRRDVPGEAPEVECLHRALAGDDPVFTTGLVLQELLQGFSGPRDARRVLDAFGALPFLVPQRADHVEAAGLRNRCRRRGIQVGTIDALLAQLCLRHELTLLTTDAEFRRMRTVCPLAVWSC